MYDVIHGGIREVKGKGTVAVNELEELLAPWEVDEGVFCTSSDVGMIDGGGISDVVAGLAGTDDDSTT